MKGSREHGTQLLFLQQSELSPDQLLRSSLSENPSGITYEQLLFPGLISFYNSCGSSNSTTEVDGGSRSKRKEIKFCC